MSTRERFEELARIWHEETAGWSAPSQIVNHKAYLEIIGMAEEALPWILDDLREHGGHWFPALGAIVGRSPVRHEDRGNVAAMTAAWLEWGDTHLGRP